MRNWSIVASVAMGLLVCAAGCAAHKEMQTETNAPQAPSPAAHAGAADTAPASEAIPQPAEAARATKVVAYYFHRTMRCPSCVKIEEYAENAVKTMFPQEIADGYVKWRALNMEQPANERFVRAFKLQAPSLILERLDDGVPRAWKNLDKVWELLDDQGMFTTYVKKELSTMLGAPAAGSL